MTSMGSMNGFGGGKADFDAESADCESKAERCGERGEDCERGEWETKSCGGGRCVLLENEYGELASTESAFGKCEAKGEGAEAEEA